MKQCLYCLMILIFLSSCKPSLDARPPISITQIPTLMLDETKSIYEIPGWLSDPGTNVLMYTQWTTNPKNFDTPPHPVTILFNPLTGARFSIKLEDAQPEEWIDNQTLGFSSMQNLGCESGVAYRYILDLSTGKLDGNNNEQKFCTLPVAELININAHGSDVKYFDGNDWVEFVPELSRLNNAYAEISPDLTTVLITQGEDEDSGELNRIGVYDFANKKELGVLLVQDLSPFFRFVGNKHKIAFFEGNTPCIFDWDAFSKECGISLPENYRYLFLDYVDDDATRIGFVYPGVYTTGDGGWVLCLYGIFDGEISCPMNKLEIFNPIRYQMEKFDGTKEMRIKADSVIDTLYSPDGNLINFSYGEGCPTCDFFPSPLRQAVVGMDGNRFFDLGPVGIHEIHNNQWRPLP